MATERNDITFGGRYLVQDQNHMSEIRPQTDKASKPLTGTASEWVKPTKDQHAAKAHASTK
jgi:hypothetical protein